MGLTEEELQPLVDAWRLSNPNIVSLWWDVDNAVKNAIKMHSSTETHGIKFTWRSGMLSTNSSLPVGSSLILNPGSARTSSVVKVLPTKV